MWSPSSTIVGQHNSPYGTVSKWPWKNIKPSIRELTEGGGRCKTWAEKLQQTIGGDIIHIVPDLSKLPNIPNTGLGPVKTKTGQIISSELKDHYAVRIGDMIFDRITGPNGMHVNKYKQLLVNSDVLTFGM